jgi:retron-type reverse transcriptase
LKNIFTPIPKKNKAQECDEHRIISLISHTSKILLQLIKSRITPIIENVLSDTQLGFRKGKGTRDAIFQIRILCENTLKRGKNIHMCFIDYKKAFDRVNHEKLMETLKWAGIPKLEQRLICNLYWNEFATIRINGKESDRIYI